MLEKQLMLETSYKIDETSKNSKGQIASYRSQIIVLFKILDKEKTVDEKIFTQRVTNGKIDNTNELDDYQRQHKNNITEKIIEEIVMYMNLK